MTTATLDRNVVPLRGESRGRVLVSGASIAGPAVAFWLHRYGFDVTIVEKASEVRGGGYAIDIRGTAIDVVERMGLLEDLQAAHIHTKAWSFVKADGRKVGSVRQEDLTGGVAGRDLELPRGALANLLFDRTRNNVSYRFGDFIASLANGDDGVDVTFFSGASERFDLVIGADGLHSATRARVFGPEEQFSRYLGYCFAGFTMDNPAGLRGEGVIFNRPGKAALLYETGSRSRVNALFVTKRPEPSRAELADIDGLRAALAEDFGGEGWLIPKMLEGARTADDLYFDCMTQIFMPSWSSGRVALVGDAAYGPSFFSGQGTSLALVGAYVLAGELAAHRDIATGLRAYEATARTFVEANQGIASEGADTMAPDSAAKLWLRNRMLALAPLLSRLGLVGRGPRKINNALKLKSYARGEALAG